VVVTPSSFIAGRRGPSLKTRSATLASPRVSPTVQASYQPGRAKLNRALQAGFVPATSAFQPPTRLSGRPVPACRAIAASVFMSTERVSAALLK